MPARRRAVAERQHGCGLWATRWLVQADAITQRAGRLARPVEDGAEMPSPAADDERPLP
jgi:hypothetical protein